MGSLLQYYEPADCKDSDPVMIRAKRIYEAAENTDGYRVLIDGLWPRGISKDKAQIDEWMKDIAPSTDLRKWFGHKPERWPEFNERYREELKSSTRAECLRALRNRSEQQDVTLVFAARDAERCNAAVLLEILAKA